MSITFKTQQLCNSFKSDIKRLDPAIDIEVIGGTYAVFEFERSHPQRIRIEQVAKSYDPTCGMRIDVKYSKRDIIESQYCRLNTTTVYVGDFGKTVLATFEGGCDACRASATQAGPLRIIKSIADRLKKAHVLDAWCGMIVSREVAENIKKLAGTSRSLRQCVSKMSGAKLDAWQIVPMASVKRDADRSTGITTDEQCQVCRRGNFFDNTDEVCRYVVPKKELDRSGRGEMLYTWECWNYPIRDKDGSVIVMPSIPLTLVRNDVAVMLLETCARSVRLVPIEVA